jgi:hypothetical protein
MSEIWRNAWSWESPTAANGDAGAGYRSTLVSSFVARVVMSFEAVICIGTLEGGALNCVNHLECMHLVNVHFVAQLMFW